MKTIKSRFLALFSSIGSLLGSCGGACGVACAASGCCGSYALFGFIGLSSSSMKFFEKLMPIFLALTILSLSYAFYKAYKPKEANCCDSENNKNGSDCCNTPKKTTFFQSKSFLWAITIMSAIMWTYPYISKINKSNSNSIQNSQVSNYHENNIQKDIEGCCIKPVNCSLECDTDEKSKNMSSTQQ